MEKTTGLEYLPYEVIEHIARYLSVQDVLACCGTCSRMRHTFSDDLVWKRKCNLELVEYLQKTESQIEPNFDWLEVMDDELSTLSPLSAWRKCYMLQIRLFQNWREGNYDKEEIEFGSYGIYESFITFYQNDHIFLHTKHIAESRVQNELWNVKESHFLHSTFNFNFKEFFSNVPNPMLDELSHKEFKVVGSKLVVSFVNAVLIYDICLTSFSSTPLSQIFLFDLSEEESKSLFSRVKTEPGIYFPIKTCVQSIICSNYFVGVVGEYKTIHIWDVQSGKKVAEEKVPRKEIDMMHLLSTSDETKKIVVKLIVLRDKFRYHYYGYDLMKLQFSSFKLKHNYCDVRIVCDKFVIGADSQQLFSYSYDTSEKLAVKRCNYHILKNSITLVGCNLLCGTSDSTVFVMDPLTLNVLNLVKLSFTLYSLKSICNRFVMINSLNTEVWEMGKTIKPLFKLPCDGSFAAVNPTCTKIALEKNNKVIILNFW